MFNKLIASAPGKRAWLRNPSVIIVSVAAHVLILGGVVWASSGPDAEPEPEPERISYIDITEIPPLEPDPEELFEAPPEPSVEQPIAPVAQQPAAAAPRPSAAPPQQRAPAVPRNPQPSPVATNQPAGFQELRAPDVELSGIPDPRAGATAVRPADFGGRGAVGGSASGIPAPAAPTTGGGGTGGTGGTAGSGGTGTGGGGGDENRTFSANLVDEPVQLTNGAEVARVLSRRYPNALREAGVEGRVVVQFVVDTNGRVEPGTIKVISASNQEFSEPSRAAITEFRFRPAKRQGRNVRQIVQLPVSWQVDR
jgi:periplasmic protein TonB